MNRGRLLPPSPSGGKSESHECFQCPLRGKEVQYYHVAFVNFLKITCLLLRPTVYFFYTYVAHDMVGIKQV